MSSLNPLMPGIGTMGLSPTDTKPRATDAIRTGGTTPATDVQAAAKPNAVAEQKKASPTAQQLQDAVDKVSKAVSGYSRELQFSVDPDLKVSVVKVVDSQTKQVIRQIPSEEMLNIAKDLDKALGVLIEQKA